MSQPKKRKPGRPAVLTKPHKYRLRLEPSQIAALKRLQKKWSLGSMAETVRHLLDNYEF